MCLLVVPMDKKEYMRIYWASHREQRREYDKKYRTMHREQLKQRKKENYLRRHDYYAGKNKKWRQSHPHYQREWMRKNRMFILKRLGNKCAHCGVSDIRILQIDHINGGGTQERLRISTDSFYKKLKALSINELKANYQLLCANCNLLKKVNEKEHLHWHADQKGDAIGRKKTQKKEKQGE